MKHLITNLVFYDFLWLSADALIGKHNPCNIKYSAEENKITCLGSVCGPCCTNCQHLGDVGCQVLCLVCKCYLCKSAMANLPNPARRVFNYLHYFYIGMYRINWAVQPHSRTSRQQWIKNIRKYAK